MKGIKDMTFAEAFAAHPALLMEAALGERLKREYHCIFDAHVAMAGLVYEKRSADALTALWTEYLGAAARHALPFLAMTPTRRANRDRVGQTAFGDGILADNVRFLREVRGRVGGPEMYVGGTLGCRGDAYTGEGALAENAAEDFHAWAAERLAGAGVDFLFAALMPSLPEAVGLARACAGTGVPYIVSFMILENGRLPDGTGLHEAIARIDAAAPVPPLCCMTNCVHPAILASALSREFNRTETVRRRFCGIQANASPLTPGQLDAGAALRTSNPRELVRPFPELAGLMSLKIAGGCCGTDSAHLEEIARKLKRIAVPRKRQANHG